MEMRVEIDAPPNGQRIFYPGMMLTGKLFVKSTKTHKKYKSINVQLISLASVCLYTGNGSGDSCETYNRDDYVTTLPDNMSTISVGSGDNGDSEFFMDKKIEVWEQGAIHQYYPIGDYEYTFSFRLDGDKLPPTYGDNKGRIIYKVLANVLDKKKKVKLSAKSHFTFVNVVDANERHLRQSAMMEVRKTLWRMFCTQGGLIYMKVTIPQTGYSINDTVPVEVFVDNGSGREIRRVIASLHRITTYKADSITHIRHRYISSATSDPVPPLTTATWKPPRLPVPQMICTVTGLRIIEIKYTISVCAVIPWANNAVIEIPIVIGNVSS